MTYRAYRWAPRVILLAAVAMIPWMVYLGVSLPGSVPARHWRLAWLGLDLGGLAALTAAWWFTRRGDRRAVPLAVMNATLVAAKVWFGMSTSRSGIAPAGPLALDGAEVSLAVLCLLLALTGRGAHAGAAPPAAVPLAPVPPAPCAPRGPADPHHRPAAGADAPTAPPLLLLVPGKKTP